MALQLERVASAEQRLRVRSWIAAGLVRGVHVALPMHERESHVVTSACQRASGRWALSVLAWCCRH
eukprot:4670568-Amphidinium_carterae.1